MSTAVEPLRLAEPQEAAPLADFLERLLRYDRAAAVRLQTAGTTLAVFARIPLGLTGPLVVRTARLDRPHPLDVTVSAGQWLEELARGPAGADVVLPPAITGPAWAGLLPPRAGWEHVEDLATAPLAAAVAAAIGEFRTTAQAGHPAADAAGRSGTPGSGAPGSDGTENEGAQSGDALAEAIWSRLVHPSGLTLRALHAAHLTGLLRQSPQIALHRHPAWLRLTAPRGSVAIRRSTPGPGLSLTPS